MSKTFEQLEPVVSALDKRIKTNFSAFPTDTAEGEIASFSDGADAPVKSLVVGIEPVQDLHGYDSSWPAGGGKNLLNASVDTGSSNGVSYTKNEDGTYTVDGTANGTSSLVVGSIELVAGTQYILSGCPSGGGGSTYNIRVRDSDYVALGFDAGAGAIITPSETKTYYCQITVVSETSVSNIVFKPMIRLASVSDGTYAPYSNICPISGWTGMQLNVNGTGIPISWESEAGTVYGGSLDVTNGVLTVDRAMVDLGALTWTVNSHATLGNYFYAPIAYMKYNGNFTQVAYNALCSRYVIVRRYSNTFTDKTLTFDGNVAQETVTQIQINDSGYSDAATFKAAMRGVQLVYELATPRTYQLTPTEIRSLLGTNNIWADTGDTTVEYRANTSAYVAKKIAEAISALS